MNRWNSLTVGHKILVSTILLALCGLLQNRLHAIELIETIVSTDSNGLEHEEYAFRAPMKSAPETVLKMYCANIKSRLYWGVFREQVDESKRKSILMRRMARLARHIFEDAKDADKPFNATRLSIIDEYYGVKDDGEEVVQDKTDGKADKPKPKYALKKLGRKLTPSWLKNDNNKVADDILDSNEPFKELATSGLKEAALRLKSYVAETGPKLALGLYTRWRTMWWMAMSCLFTKYYLWDPALDEFIKLKRSLVMYPEFQLVKLQDLECKPTIFFRRILDICKILNPLMNFDFGQFSLDKMTRFKSGMS